MQDGDSGRCGQCGADLYQSAKSRGSTPRLALIEQGGQMSTKAKKELVKYLESSGFEYDRTNTKSIEYYRHPSHPEVGVSTVVDDQVARRIRALVQKALGQPTDKDKSKRSAETVRIRQAATRESVAADVARHEVEIADLLRQRDSRMDGLGRVLTGSELRAIERLIESKERELRGWRRLMTELPTNRAHSGRPGPQHHA